MKLKILLALPAFLILTSVIFADTYLYRVPIATKSKLQLTQQADIIGVKNIIQPFYGTYVLDGNATYYLLKVTPADGQNPKLPYDLYQIQALDEEGFIRPIVDNSKIFPIFQQDEPLVVQKSSGT